MEKYYPIIHTMQNYDFIEGIEFDSLMGAVMESGVTTIGTDGTNVHMFGKNANGMDVLEVVDITSLGFGHEDGKDY